MADPVDNPVTAPTALELTVAALPAVLQSPPLTVLVNVITEPLHTDDTPPIAAGVVKTVNGTVDLQEPME